MSHNSSNVREIVLSNSIPIDNTDNNNNNVIERSLPLNHFNFLNVNSSSCLSLISKSYKRLIENDEYILIIPQNPTASTKHQNNFTLLNSILNITRTIYVSLSTTSHHFISIILHFHIHRHQKKW